MNTAAEDRNNANPTLTSLLPFAESRRSKTGGVLKAEAEGWSVLRGAQRRAESGGEAGAC